MATIDEVLSRIGSSDPDMRRADCLENVPTSYEGDRDLVATLDTIMEMVGENHVMLKALLLMHGRELKE